jgi:C4-dicarboxylate-specific signal transduction histidine kinase
VNFITRARRRNGEAFPASIWISTYKIHSEPRLAAIVLDASEEMRERENSGLSQVLSSARIVMGAVSHEVRNLCGAINVVYSNLRRTPGLAENEDFRAFSHLIDGLRKIASAELLTPARRVGAQIRLSEVVDDLQIVIDPICRDAEVSVLWDISENLPLVRAEHHSLLQALLNLVQNATAAMENCTEKTLRIAFLTDENKVKIRIHDSGNGVKDSERLFQPFQTGASMTGLGLYLSRAMVQAFGGNVVYEPSPRGACFVVELARVERAVEVVV